MSELANVQSHLTAWRAQRPESRLLEVFAKPSTAEIYFACWMHQIERTVFEVRDTKVASTKLSWWHSQVLDDEVDANTSDQTPAMSHPILMALRGEATFKGVAESDWQRLFEAALQVLDPPPIQSMDELQSLFGALGAAAARIEAILAGRSPHAGSTSETRIWRDWLMLFEWREFHRRQLRERVLWPLSWRAKHGLPSPPASMHSTTFLNAEKRSFSRASEDAVYVAALQGVLREFVTAMRHNASASTSAPKAAPINLVREALTRVALSQAHNGAKQALQGDLAWPRWRTPWTIWKALRAAR